MLYFVTALYEEALPFIKKYNLKRKTDFPHFELFTGEGAMLLVTRPGALRAAAALSSVLTAFPPAKNDLLFSVGCAGCASESMLGKAFLICRITEEASGRTRYPDLLFRCPFPQAEVVTQAKVRTENFSGTQAVSDGTSMLQSGTHPKPDLDTASENVPPETNLAAELTTPLPLLYDMEAAGIYEAAIPYFSCDRLFFLKVVSDALTGLLELPEAGRRAHVIGCIESIMQQLSAWIEELTTTSFPQNKAAPEHSASPCETSSPGLDDTVLFTEICTALHLSIASSKHLHQLMLYLTLSGIPYADSMRELLAAPLATPCRSKKEGLKYLELLGQYYL